VSKYLDKVLAFKQSQTAVVDNGCMQGARTMLRLLQHAKQT